MALDVWDDVEAKAYERAERDAELNAPTR